MLRTLIPGFWMGVLVALAFIETPLKFHAPGITVPLALGIGRLVLTAAEIASVVLLIALTVVTFAKPRLGRGLVIVVGALWVTLAVQMAVIRPMLNARTDIVLGGGDPGESSLHVIYVVTDVILVALMIAYLAIVARRARLTVPGGRVASALGDAR